MEDRNADAASDGNFGVLAGKIEIAERLKTAIRAAGGNQEVAAKSGVPIGTLNNYVRAVSDPRASALGLIALACGVSLDWLVLGRDGGGSRSAESSTAYDAAQAVVVPRYDIAAAAGAGALAEDGPPLEYVPFPLILLRSLRSNPRNLVMIEVAGDSMEPTLGDGDVILIDRSIRQAGDGVYVFRMDGQLAVKRLQLVGRTLSIISDNPAYPTREVSGHDLEQLKIIGKVVWPKG